MVGLAAEVTLEGDQRGTGWVTLHCVSHSTFVLHLLLICCRDPIHWNLPFTIMASLVQRASHSSMLKDSTITSEFWAQKIRFQFMNMSITISLWHFTHTLVVPEYDFSLEERKPFLI